MPSSFELDCTFGMFEFKCRLLHGMQDIPINRAVAPLLHGLVDLLKTVTISEWETLEAARSRWESNSSCAAMVIDSMGDLVAEVTAGLAHLSLQKLVRRNHEPFRQT